MFIDSENYKSVIFFNQKLALEFNSFVEPAIISFLYQKHKEGNPSILAAYFHEHFKFTPKSAILKKLEALTNAGYATETIKGNRWIYAITEKGIKVMQDCEKQLQSQADAAAQPEDELSAIMNHERCILQYNISWFDGEVPYETLWELYVNKMEPCTLMGFVRFLQDKRGALERLQAKKESEQRDKEEHELRDNLLDEVIKPHAKRRRRANKSIHSDQPVDQRQPG